MTSVISSRINNSSTEIPMYGSLRLPASGRLLCTVEHPPDAVPVERATPVTPRHLHHARAVGTTLAQRSIEAVRLLAGVRIQVDRDVVADLQFAHRLEHVGAHQHVSGEDGELDVRDQ